MPGFREMLDAVRARVGAASAPTPVAAPAPQPALPEPYPGYQTVPGGQGETRVVAPDYSRAPVQGPELVGSALSRALQESEGRASTGQWPRAPGPLADFAAANTAQWAERGRVMQAEPTIRTIANDARADRWQGAARQSASLVDLIRK